jgi:methyltransferase
MFIAGLVIVVFGLMAVEACLAASNEASQRRRGGIEPAEDVYSVMRIAYPAAFVAMILEGFIRGVAAAPVLAAGIALFAAAKGLKWWAIWTLGPFWTFRVIVVPDTFLVVTGPYRFMRHPNYLAVIAELIAVALIAGAVIIGPVATLAFGLLIRKRIAVEERALGAILPRN